MDVLCERCNTRYEFDESLVSSRGTTVKCTQCGLLFRVFPPEGRTSVESWTVQRLDGERFAFRKMRELQAAITRGRVGPDDVLIPSVGRPKRLGDIEELASFFPTGATTGGGPPRRPNRSGGTRIGLAPPPEAKLTRVEPSVGRHQDRDGHPLPARTGMTLPPPGVDSAPSLELDAVGRPPSRPAVLAADDPEAPTLQVGLREILTPPPAPSSSIGEAVAAVEQAMAAALGPGSQRQGAAANADRPSSSSRETRVRDDAEDPTRLVPPDRETRVRDTGDEPTRLVPPDRETRVRDEPDEPTAPVMSEPPAPVMSEPPAPVMSEPPAPVMSEPPAPILPKPRAPVARGSASDRETRVRDEPDEPTRRMPPERETRIRDDVREPVPVLARSVRAAIPPPRRPSRDTAPDLVVSTRGRPDRDVDDTGRDVPDSARPTLPRGEDSHLFEEGELDITHDDPREVEPAGRHDGHLPVTITEGPPSHPPSHPDSDGGASMPPLTPSPSVARPSILGRAGAHSGPRFSSYAGGARRPSFARWAVGLIVLGVLGVGGYTAIKRYLPTQDNGAGARPQDARIDRFLRAGRDRLIAGDLEGAREQYVMASGVDDQEPRVLEALADVEIARADQAWLHLQLLPAESPERAGVQKQLAQQAKRAEETAERLAAAAPRTRGAVRSRLAVLRLRGELDSARSLVDQLPNPGPEDAMVLAALDLGAAEPSWTTVLDRLQTAARAEQRLGRAAAYFVYAAALAHQRERAREQLDLLGSYSPPHPLVEPLRLWLDSLPEDAADSADAGGAATADASAPGSDGDEGIPSDFREALKKAREAVRAGNLDRAESLYRAALEKNPGNNEALAGLAEIARGRGDSGAAIRAYEALLRQNPGYVPALAALADLKWQTGAGAEARALYRQVIEAAPGSSYAKHARARLDSSDASSSAASSEPKTPPAATHAPKTPPPPPTEPSAPAATAPGELPPGVDISDLPELH